MRCVSVIAFIALAAVSATAQSSTSCLLYSTCSSCTGASGCGWSNGVACYPGTSSGATFPYSSTISWAWSSSSCGSSSTGSCPSTSYCTTCILTSGCGWDGTTCRAGTYSGPTSGFGTGTWAYSSCSCSSSRTCTSCTWTSGCGWDGSTCRSGSSLGPYSGSASTWYYGFCSSSWAVTTTGLAALGVGLYLIIVGVILFWVCVCGCIVYRCVIIPRRTQTVVVAAAPINGMGGAYVAGPM